MTAQPQERPPGFRPGERAPDFLLPNPHGKFGRFYDRFQGNLVVLVFTPSSVRPEAVRALRDLQARAGDFAEAGARIVAVTPDEAEANARLAAEHGLDFTLFSDPAGAIARGYGADTAGGFLSYAIDRNQRILTVFPDGTEHAGRALDYVRDAVPAPPPGRCVSAQAPVLLIPGAIDPELCARAIRAWEADHEEGAIRLRARNTAEAAADARTRVVDYSVKKRLDHRPDDTLNRALTAAVMERIGPEIYRAFHFQIAAVERFCIGAYEAGRGDYFRPHRDNSTKQTEKRRFAVTLNLNDAYEGGGVRFPEFGDDIYLTPAGGALIFSCTLLHEAVPVTQGIRFAALTFMFGPGDVAPPRPKPG